MTTFGDVVNRNGKNKYNSRGEGALGYFSWQRGIHTSRVIPTLRDAHQDPRMARTSLTTRRWAAGVWVAGQQHAGRRFQSRWRVGTVALWGMALTTYRSKRTFAVESRGTC